MKLLFIRLLFDYSKVLRSRRAPARHVDLVYSLQIAYNGRVNVQERFRGQYKITS